MKKAHVFGIAFAFFALASVPAGARAAEGPCSEPGGMPLAENDAIQCTVSTEITRSGNRSLPSATFGLIQLVRVKSVLRLPLTSNALFDALGQHVIQIPPQDISIDVVFSDGRILPAVLTLAPSVTVDGGDACALTATAAAINLTRFDSGLPDWIDATVVRYVNDSEDVKAKLLAGAAAALTRLQAQYCF